MNIISIIADTRTLFTKGKALKGSGFLNNTEAFSAALYAFLSALVVVLNDLGLQVTVGGTDLHTVANGWTITASLVYSIYRIVTNPIAGFSSNSPPSSVQQ